MVDKRLRKLESAKAEIIEPQLYPNRKYNNLVVCWGSTYPVVKEAIELLGKSDTSLLHYSQIYPLHPKTADYLSKAKKSCYRRGQRHRPVCQVDKITRRLRY